MSRLDKFVEVLFLRGAEGLIFETGSAAYLQGPGETRLAVMQRTLTREQIISAVAEMMPPHQAQGFSGTDWEHFEYTAPAGTVKVQFVAEGEKVRAEIRSAGPVKAAVITPDPPDSAPAPLANPTAQRAAPTLSPPPATRSPRPAAPVAEETGSPPLQVSQAPSDPAEAMAALLDLCGEHKASDLHLTSGGPPALRIDGDIRLLEGWGEPSAKELKEMLFTITPPRSREEWQKSWDADFAHEAGDTRFRVNLFSDRSGIAAVLRRIPGKVFSAAEMEIPDKLLELCFLSKGMVLVTGPTGSGKSTTLAAMIDHVNRNRDDNIITIEDPVEFVHQAKRCRIHQREIGSHTASFKAALRAALREDPDVILVGEMRDLETVSIALETAETGHLVFGTLHTNTAPSTVDRIIDQFPADRQSQVRTMLSESLKAVITQTLCKRIGGGRVAAREVMMGNAAVANLIREGKTFQLASILQTGKAQGMQTLNDALIDLVRRKLVTPEEALAKSISRPELRKSLEVAGLIKAEA